MFKFKKLILTGLAVAMAGMFGMSCEVYDDGLAYVRYTWALNQQPNLLSVSASTADVKWWVENVWLDGALPDEAFVGDKAPAAWGNPSAPDNLYSSTIGSSGSAYRGVYYPVDPKVYTAIASVIDPQYSDTFDIIANYRIEVDEGTSSAAGEDWYFELGFDIAAALADVGDYKFQYSPDKNRPYLFKSKLLKKETIVKKGAKMDVVYYIVPRKRA
jgi:hypothetical protein